MNRWLDLQGLIISNLIQHNLWSGIAVGRKALRPVHTSRREGLVSRYAIYTYRSFPSDHLTKIDTYELSGGRIAPVATVAKYEQAFTTVCATDW